MKFTIDAFATTHAGNVRRNNEDFYLLFEEYKKLKSLDWERLVEERGALYIVADGLGGHAAGEVASKTAALAFADAYYSLPADVSLEDGIKKLFVESAMSAHRAILNKVEADTKKYHGMGTTLTAGIVLKDLLWVSHIGDSRLFILRGGRLEQVTKDHTIIQRFVDKGALTKEEARMAPRRSSLTKAVGIKPEYKDEFPAPDIYKSELLSGDRVLICSDGLTDMVEDEKIEKILTEVKDIEECADKLLNAALEAGGKDNITILMIYVGG